jgi:V-type H+-transporting ATPase proteolipid subunit
LKCNQNADNQILILIFAEVLGLYGLIVALILNTNSSTDYTVSYIG